MRQFTISQALDKIFDEEDAACYGKTSDVWNLQIYTGKPASRIPVKIQGKRVVHNTTTNTTGLRGHSNTGDNFFNSYTKINLNCPLKYCRCTGLSSKLTHLHLTVKDQEIANGSVL